MAELVEQMKVCLASTFSMYLKAHNYHWNVEGPSFVTFHKFFGDVYSDLWNSVDDIAEHIRTLDAYAPGSLQRFKDLSVVEDEQSIPSPLQMAKRLQQDNEKLISEFIKADKLATDENKTGLANFIQERIDAHHKLNWMLKSITKAV